MASSEHESQNLPETLQDESNILSPVIGLRVRDLAASGAAVLKQAVLQPAIGVEYSARFVA